MVNGAQRYSVPMVTLTTILAMAFGLSIAFLDVTPSSQPIVFWLGAAIVGILFVVFLLIPFIRGLAR